MPRRVQTILAIFILCAMHFALSGAASPESLRTVIPTPLCAEPSFSSALLTEIPQNEPVTPLGEPTSGDPAWIRVECDGRTGYVPFAYLYPSSGVAECEFELMKVTCASSTAKVGVYAHRDLSGAPLALLGDGMKVGVSPDPLPGGVRKVVAGDVSGYMPGANLTTGLTRNQRLAVIASCALVGVAIVFISSLAVASARKRRALYREK